MYFSHNISSWGTSKPKLNFDNTQMKSLRLVLTEHMAAYQASTGNPQKTIAERSARCSFRHVLTALASDESLLSTSGMVSAEQATATLARNPAVWANTAVVATPQACTNQRQSALACGCDDLSSWQCLSCKLHAGNCKPNLSWQNAASWIQDMMFVL